MRVLQVIAKAPRANEDEFIRLIERASTETDCRDPVAEDLAELLLCHTDGVLACRDFPKQMAKLTLSRFLMSDAELERILEHAKEMPFGSSISDSRFNFGLREVGNFDYDNPSDLRGPFKPLLVYHPHVGLELVLKLVNHAGNWYGTRKWPWSRAELPTSVTVSVAGQERTEQWIDERLWNAYRGTSNVPTVIPCSLMALESWLLAIDSEDILDKLLLKILGSSNNVLTTSVVASVCTARPTRTGSAALSLLNSRELIQIDLLRLSKEINSRLTTGISLNPLSEVYSVERTRSNELEHRQHSLETLAVKLQLGDRRREMWRILDAHFSEIPDESARDLTDQQWLLALHRMDVRKFAPVPSPSDSTSGDPNGDFVPKVAFGPDVQEMDADVRELVGQSDVEIRKFNDASRLLSWTKSQWDHEPDTADDDFWIEALSQVRDESVGTDRTSLYFGEVPHRVAAVCVRDHWEEMDAPARQWCLTTLAREIASTSDDTDFMDPFPGFPFVGSTMLASGFAAYTFPKVIASDPDNTGALEALANAVTHSSEQVVFNASQGIAEYLTAVNPELTLQCAAAIAMRARLLGDRSQSWSIPNAESTSNKRSRWTALKEVWRTISRIPSLLRRPVQESTPEHVAISKLVRERLLEGSIDVELELTKFDLASLHGLVALRSILEILTGVPSSPLSRKLFKRVACSILDRSASEYGGVIPIHIEQDKVKSLARYILRLPRDQAITCCQPLLDAVDERPDEVANFIESLIRMEDKTHPQATCFWDVWTAMTTRIVSSPWLCKIADTRSMGVKLVNAILLLDVPRREDIRHWRGLDGHEDEVSELMPSLPATLPVLEAYVRYLYRIGERSLPKSFTVVEAVLKAVAKPEALLDSGNTVFCLEMLLQRHVHAEPHRLKADPNLRPAVLFLLDQLVDAGSSMAYRMRDDFVTPAHAWPD